MSALVVRVLTGAFDRQLSSDPTIVPAAPAVLAVTGARTRDFTLDGQRCRLTAGSTGLYSIDLTRSTGYHRVEIDGVEHWFATHDAKLGIQGLQKMLDSLGSLGTGWTGQVMFSNGAGLRDPHVSYGWLDRHADKALRAVEAILEAPRSATLATQSLRRRGGSGVLLAPTLRLLRSDPNRYLVETSNGAVEFEGRRFEPLRVVAKDRKTTLQTPANKRAVAILPWIERLADDVIMTSENAKSVGRTRLWKNKAETLMLRPLAKSLGAVDLPPDQRQTEEVIDPNYRTSLEIALNLSQQFGWNASTQPTSRSSYVRYADEIYQVYIAARIAQSLGLHQTSPVLGATQPAFTNEEFDLYLDSPPARGVLRSWRFYSDLPDTSRPDVVLVERSTGRVAVMDAKYRIARDGYATEDSRKEVSAYMGLYGLDSIAIGFPGKQDHARTIDGGGKRIVECPISPEVEDVTPTVDALIETLQIPPF